MAAVDGLVTVVAPSVVVSVPTVIAAAVVCYWPCHCCYHSQLLLPLTQTLLMLLPVQCHSCCSYCCPYCSHYHNCCCCCQYNGQLLVSPAGTGIPTTISAAIAVLAAVVVLDAVTLINAISPAIVAASPVAYPLRVPLLLHLLLLPKAATMDKL